MRRQIETQRNLTHRWYAIAKQILRIARTEERRLMEMEAKQYAIQNSGDSGGPGQLGQQERDSAGFDSGAPDLVQSSAICSGAGDGGDGGEGV